MRVRGNVFTRVTETTVPLVISRQGQFPRSDDLVQPGAEWLLGAAVEAIRHVTQEWGPSRQYPRKFSGRGAGVSKFAGT